MSFLLLASLLALVPAAAGAQQQSGSGVVLPLNSDCRGAAVIAKAKVTEDAAAANMLAEALRVLSPKEDQRCMLDAGLPSEGRAPDREVRRSAGVARKVYVVGGPAAIPDEWLEEHFGVTEFIRVAGVDRWRTQENVAAAIVALANGRQVVNWDPSAPAERGFAPNGSCYGTAVLAKTNVHADWAAANMLAVALTAISGDPDSRCLISAGDPSTKTPPNAVALAEALQPSGVYLIGGDAAVPDEWLENHFDIRFLERLDGKNRWVTQSRVAKEIVDIVQGGTLPHQYVDSKGQKYSVYDNRRINISDPSELFVRGNTERSGTGSFTVPVHYCLSEGNSRSNDSLAQELSDWVEELNKVVSEFFSRESSDTVTFEFTQGRVHKLNSSLASVTAWDKTFVNYPVDTTDKDKQSLEPNGYWDTDENDRQDHAAAPVEQCLLLVDEGYVFVDQPLLQSGTGGFAANRDIAASPAPNQVTRWLFTVAHEVGHAWLDLCHPQTSLSEPDTRRSGTPREVTFQCRSGHANLVYDSYEAAKITNMSGQEIPASSLTERKKLGLCGLMSYCADSSLTDTGDNLKTFVACGQRELLGWPDGPATPYGPCASGKQVLGGQALRANAVAVSISSIDAQWGPRQSFPVAEVALELPETSVCGPQRQPEYQLSFKKVGFLQRGRDTAWMTIDADRPVHTETIRASGTYGVRARGRCPSGNNRDEVLSEWSDRVEFSTPDSPAPGTPGAPSSSSAEANFITFVWSAASGDVERHEVQWRPAEERATWQSRTQQNNGRFSGIGDLSPGTCYEFRVRAGNGGGWGAWSPTTEICTTGSTSLPNVANLNLRWSSGTGTVSVNWTVPLVYSPQVLDNVKGFEIQQDCTGSIVKERAAASARSHTIRGLAAGGSCRVRVAAVGANGEPGRFTSWERVTLDPPSSVSISAGPINRTRTDSNSCGAGNDCHDLSYDIRGLGSGPYTLECRLDGQRIWRGTWSGRASAGCYYSSAFSGTIQVVIDGVTSNTISVTGARRASAPDAPGGVSVKAGDRQVTVSWQASAGNGSPVTGYLVAWGGGGVIGGVTLPGSARSHTITGLVNGTRYEVSVSAQSTAGHSAETTRYATPQATARVPDAPGRPSLSGGDGSVTVSWRLPSANGAAVSGQQVRWRAGGSWSSRSVSASATRYTISGLNSGSNYEVQVRARNGVGWGAWSQSATATTDRAQPQASVSISAGSVNRTRTNSNSCGTGNDCHDLSYDIRGLGSGPYTLECRLDGQRTWRGTWSGRASAGCYYSSAFSGTIQVVIDGVTSNTISVSGRAPRTTAPPTATRRVVIAHGPVNASRTNRGSCGGNNCHDLSYDIQGLGSGPYTLECWFNGRRAWRGTWSGRASAGCYYWSTFSGTIHVVIDGVTSNTVRR